MRKPITKSLAGTLAAGALTLAVGVSAASAEPMSVKAPGHFAQPPTTAMCEAQIGIACYTPAQYEQAYGTDQLYAHGITGAGQTIVIVDSFGSPTITQDLAEFDAETGLPAPPSFKIIQPDGPVPAYDPTDGDMGGWVIETSLDVEMAHEMAPGANILLVETPVSETEGITGLPQMMDAEEYVINHHLGNIISQSFGATEQTFSSPSQVYGLRYAYEDAAAHNVTVLAASGDAGSTDYELNGTDFFPFRATDWPASDPLVTSVGGLQLHLDANGNRTAPDNVWNDQALFGSPAAGGGGLSILFSRPQFQDRVAYAVHNSRGVPDVSASAAVNGAADVYISAVNGPEGLTGPGWYLIGGTSEATPLTAGIVALADQVAHHSLGDINPALYEMGDGWGSGLTDITAGNNTVTFTNSNNVTYTVPGWNAVPGYDLASGLGTPYAPRFVYELAALSH